MQVQGLATALAEVDSSDLENRANRIGRPFFCRLQVSQFGSVSSFAAMGTSFLRIAAGARAPCHC
jgi:hypothetical protein